MINDNRYTEFFSKNNIKITKRKELALREYWVNPTEWSLIWYYRQSVQRVNPYYKPIPLTELDPLEIHDILTSWAFKKFFYRKCVKDFFKKPRRDPNHAGI